MDYEHITPELLEAHFRGELPKGFFQRLLLRHLGQRCPACRHAIARWQSSRRPRVDGLLVAAHDALLRSLADAEPDLKRRWNEAKRDLRVLRRLSPEERQQRVMNAKTRMRGIELGELMIGESRKALPARPEDSSLWAHLASMVIWLSPREYPRQRGLFLLASAFEANGRRTLDERTEAAGTFSKLRAALDQDPTIDPEIEAEITSLEASLWKDLRHFRRAHALLIHARHLYSICGQTSPRARVSIQLAEVERESGHPDLAISTLLRLLPDLAELEQPRLLLCARHNLAFSLCEDGQYEQAAIELRSTHALYEQFGDAGTQLQRRWLEAKIQHGLAQLEEAERSFLEAREGFVDLGSGYDAAMVSLELANVYYAQGKIRELKKLAAELEAVFRAGSIHREATAALLLFQEAVRAEDLTERLLQRVQHFLLEARCNPDLPFRRV